MESCQVIYNLFSYIEAYQQINKK